MTITAAFKKILDRKQWEMVAPAPVASVAGSFIISSTLDDQLQLYVTNVSAMYLYAPKEDGWMQILASGLGGTFGAGSCGTHHPNGPTGTATSAGARTLNTNLNIPGSLAGYKIRITGGTGAGQEATIASNTFGANSVITVAAPWSVAPDATSTYMIQSGRFWVFVGNNATPALRFYDVATNTWSAALSVTGIPANFATDGKLRSTPGGNTQFGVGTASAGGASTLTDGAKAWTVNQWTNSQVRIVAGTGAGQVRTIASNTGTVLTTSAAWAINPNATSQYVIEGNDDFLYLVGNNAVAMYRYSIAGNTWTTLAPGAARAAAPGAGMSLIWVKSIADAEWSTENAILNGRRLYSFRGGATSDLHYYDIAANTWVTVQYLRQFETFSTGTSWESGGNGKLYGQKDSTSRFFRFDVLKNTMDPLGTMPLPQGAALVGNRLFSVDVVDGGTKLTWIYQLRNSAVDVLRMLII